MIDRYCIHNGREHSAHTGALSSGGEGQLGLLLVFPGDDPRHQWATRRGNLVELKN